MAHSHGGNPAALKFRQPADATSINANAGVVECHRMRFNRAPATVKCVTAPGDPETTTTLAAQDGHADHGH